MNIWDTCTYYTHYYKESLVNVSVTVRLREADSSDITQGGAVLLWLWLNQDASYPLGREAEEEKRTLEQECPAAALQTEQAMPHQNHAHSD